MATESTNGVHRLDGQLPDFTTLMFKKDLHEASKAIYDSTQAEVKTLVKQLEHEVLVTMGKHIDRIVQERVAAEVKGFKEHVGILQKAYETGQQTIALLLKNITVNVPEHAIQVHQQPSVVHLSIPEGAIEMKSLPSIVNVTIPENAIKMADVTFNAAPITNQFSVPENAIKMADINFSVPKDALQLEVKSEVSLTDKAFNIKLHQDKAERKVVEKSIIYSQTTGRPEKIVETIEGS